MSYADLIQCIGRGLRSDCQGENAKNNTKELYLMIPNYISEDNADNYHNIINVIQYLQDDIGLDWEDIKCLKTNRINSEIHSSYEDYEGEKIVKSKIMEANKLKKIQWSLTKIIRYCKNNHIHSNKEYYDFKEKYAFLLLPEDIPYGLNWSDTYRKHNYYSKEECIEAIQKIYEINSYLESMEDHEEIIQILNNIDPKIPNNRLCTFYGGSDSDFIIFN